jgi:hypothetical protein
MSALPPDFDALVGEGLAAEEQNRLRRVHELLLAAGPPPELTPALGLPPSEPRASLFTLPRRPRGAVLLLAAAIALALFSAGFLAGGHHSTAAAVRVIPMLGSGQAAGAHASLAIFKQDEAGNWPIRLTVSGLPPLPARKTYALWLSRQGTLAATCGTFIVGRRTTIVTLNAPYRLRAYDGWVIVRTRTKQPLLSTGAAA